MRIVCSRMLNCLITNYKIADNTKRVASFFGNERLFYVWGTHLEPAKAETV